MKIQKVEKNKKSYLELLLLADEQESMIDRYLERGEMFLCTDQGEVKAECVVTKEEQGIYEIKNLATVPTAQKQGYGRALIDFVFSYYQDCNTLYVGTGDSPMTIPFYEKCGFHRSHIVKDFFLMHYDHPIFEEGQQLIDMIYLKRERIK